MHLELSGRCSGPEGPPLTVSPKRLCVRLGAQSPAFGSDVGLCFWDAWRVLPPQGLGGWQIPGPTAPGHLAVFRGARAFQCSVQPAALPDSVSSVLAQEQAGRSPWGTVASATGSSPHGVSAAFLAGHLGRAQTHHPRGSVFSSGTSSTCWGWLSTRTQLCLSLSARTATPSSTSATASSSPSCRESTSPRRATGRLAQSRHPLLPPPLIWWAFRGQAPCVLGPV